MTEAIRGDDVQVFESLLSAPEALARHEHVLITAEPGAGKSTLSSHIAWTLSRIWLRQESSLNAPLVEPVIPIRIRARTLVDQTGSWSSVLCQAARRSLGRSLIADPDPNLFAGRVHGARWLLMVDGLDEIADRDARMGVIRTIAQHTQAGSNYRFVVTSRPLPEAELSPLRGSHIGTYSMEPFAAAELRDFASKWFAAQYESNTEQARAATDRFLKETEDGRLHELVRNPLLATIAAVNATIDRSRPLPTSRLSLYQSFCEHLLTRGESVLAARTELNRLYRDDPERRSFHLWLDQHKWEILGVLGKCRLEGENSLSETALNWVLEHAEKNVLLPGWQTEVQEFIQGTGLLVPEEEDYRFLHHSFAEFMAAQSRAVEISPAFPEAEEWIRRAFKDDEQAYVMFVFCLWSERAECTADRIVDQLLTETRGGYDRFLLAGLLWAEGASLHGRNRVLILDHLEAIARNAEHDYSEKSFKLLGGLGEQSGALNRVKEIASSKLLDPMRRLYAVEAFSRAGDTQEAEDLLSSILDWIYGGIQRAAEVACSISEGAREAVRRRAWSIADGPDSNVFLLSYAASALECLGQTQEVAEIACRVVKDPIANPAELERATESWVKAVPTDASTVSQLISNRPIVDQRGRAVAAKVLEKLGESEAAARIAGEVLKSSTPDTVALTSAALTWIKVQGAEGRSEVRAVFAKSSADLGHDLDTPAELLQSIAQFLEEGEIETWAQDVLGEHPSRILHGGKVVSAWLAADGGAAVDKIMARIGRGHQLEAYSRAEAAESLHSVGARNEARELAELALRTPNLSRARYKQSCEVLTGVAGDGVASLLQRIWDESSGLGMNSAWLSGVLESFTEQEVDLDIPLMNATASHFARNLIDLGSANSGDVIIALEALGETEGRESFAYIAKTAITHPRISWVHKCDVARGLAALGETRYALEVWRHVISLPYPPQRGEVGLLMDIQDAGFAREASAWIRELIDDPGTYSPRRLLLRQMLAWLTAAEEARLESIELSSKSPNLPHSRLTN
ncbi:NACHT domain-containing protein [Streptomyces sp. NPDC002324]